MPSNDEKDADREKPQPSLHDMGGDIGPVSTGGRPETAHPGFRVRGPVDEADPDGGSGRTG